MAQKSFVDPEADSLRSHFDTDNRVIEMAWFWLVRYLDNTN